jgi:peptidoglycan/LPS O-acetylase OafA/YrhL
MALTILSLYGVVFGLMLTFVGSFSGPHILLPGVGHLVGGVGALVLRKLILMRSRRAANILMVLSCILIVLLAFVLWKMVTRGEELGAFIVPTVFLALVVGLLMALISKDGRHFFEER